MHEQCVGPVVVSSGETQIASGEGSNGIITGLPETDRNGSSGISTYKANRFPRIGRAG
jgi:hypothetical protein